MIFWKATKKPTAAAVEEETCLSKSVADKLKDKELEATVAHWDLMHALGQLKTQLDRMPVERGLQKIADNMGKKA